MRTMSGPRKALLFFGILLVAGLPALAWFMIFRDRALIEPVFDYQDPEYTWNARIGDIRGDMLVRGTKIDLIKDDIHKLIAAFNRSGQNPESFRTRRNREPLGTPKLRYIDLQARVVRVEVINAEYLTQRMGTTGADAFMATATFTLTEHEGTDAVAFVFKEGDHAVPGIYSRAKFELYWRIENHRKEEAPPGERKAPPAFESIMTARVLHYPEACR